MQALGSYHGGKMLFLGLGTGIGAAVILGGVLEPLEIGRFHYKKRTLEYYVGARGRKRQGQKKWQREVEKVVARFIEVLKPTDVVLGGGNAKKLKPLPPGARLGDNAFAFLGGFRMWEPEAIRPQPTSPSENGADRSDPGDQQPLRRTGRQPATPEHQEPQP
jgi:polyphosphate glucokinase